MKNISGFILLIIFMITGCKEPFEPSISASDKIIVVDGLISNNPENYFVKLSYAAPFTSTVKTYEPVANAVVVVKDDTGNSFTLHEYPLGTYQTYSSEFVPEAGRTYTLVITDQKGTTYESTPQTMQEALPVSNVHGNLIDKQYLVSYTEGDQTVVTKNGALTYVSIKKPSENNLNFRFANAMVIEVSWTGIPSGAIFPTTYYGWYVKAIDDLANITGSDVAVGTSDIVDFQESFFPDQKEYYSIPDSESVYNWILVMKEYALTAEASKYYKDINNQLSSGGKLFDPISAQVRGNMHCTTDPGKQILGFFEASGSLTTTYIVLPSYTEVGYLKVDNLGNIPVYGHVAPGLPNFWR